MATKIELISTDYLKSNTAISGNVDVDNLKPFISQAQDIYIQELLGSALYNQILDEVELSGNSVSATTASLLALIAPCLAFYTLSLALPFQLIQIKNKGLVKNSNPATGAASAELREMTYLVENTNNTAEFYGQRIVKYLCNHSEDYPAYSNQGSDPDIYPTNNSYKGGFGGFYSSQNNIDADALRKWLGI